MRDIIKALEELRQIYRDNPQYTIDDAIDEINLKIVNLHVELDRAVATENAENVVERIMNNTVDDFWGHSKVNGTTFRPDLPWAQLRNGLRLELVREPTNEHDKNAIKVMFVEYHLGYIPKDTAAKLAPLMDDGAIMFYSRITDITGGVEEKENRGINLGIHFKKKEE